MFRRIVLFIATLGALVGLALPISVGAVAGDYDYSIVFSAGNNIQNGKILVGKTAPITATLVDKNGTAVAADSKTSWKMKNTTSIGTVSDFTVATDRKSASVKYQAPNESGRAAVIEASTVKNGRTFTNTYSVTTATALVSTSTTKIGAGVTPVVIPDLVGTGGETKGFWGSLTAGFSQMSATTWIVIIVILVCLLVILGLARKEKPVKK